MARRSGGRVGIRTSFGWMSAPIESLGTGTIVLMLFTEATAQSCRALKPLFRTSRRRKSTVSSLVGDLVGIGIAMFLFPFVFALFILIYFGPWVVCLIRSGRKTGRVGKRVSLTAPKSSPAPLRESKVLRADPTPFCMNCGRRLVEGETYCGRCGAPNDTRV
jgi:hypothetical protein